jgi:hypothetical protein
MILFNLLEIRLLTKKQKIKEILLSEGKIKAAMKYKELNKTLAGAKDYVNNLAEEIGYNK